MPKSAFNYFFTLQDDDFILKGARDPLGFQIIWQNTARQLIPHLNTVCGNLKDWQILCLGHALHTVSSLPEDIIPFFIRFEQLMAHARLRVFPEESFNGVEKVKRIRNEGGATIRIGNQPGGRGNSPELLTNQRSYGIWGKYISPFKEMHLQQLPNFQTLWKKKLEIVSSDPIADKLLKAVMKRDGAEIRVAELEKLKPLLTIENEEPSFFQQYLLWHPEPAHIQNQLYQFCTSHSRLDNLYTWLEQLAQNGTPELVAAVRDIQQTEQVLCPLNRFFRGLQIKNVWSVADIEADEYFQACCQPTPHDGLAGRYVTKKRELAQWQSLSIKEILKALLKENEGVAAARGGSPWMQLNNHSLLEVLHTEGGYHTGDIYQPGKDYDNSYFLNTYTHLFQQATAT